jgi:hypothetical protein
MSENRATKRTGRLKGRPRVGRPPVPWSPLQIEIEPQLKMDLVMAARQLGLKLKDLIEPLLDEARGAPGQTEQLMRSWRRAKKRKEK